MFNAAQEMDNVINFGIGEPDFDTPEVIREAAAQAARDSYTHYTANAGLAVLRSAIAEKLSQENGIVVDPGTSVIITVGAMQALFMAIIATANPADEILLPDPGWTNYEGQAILCGGEIRRVPLSWESGFELTANDVQQCVTERSTLLMLNSPANPTGAMICGDELDAIAEVAARHDLTIISDEVYEYFVWDDNRHESVGSREEARERTITIGSFSKSYAMTGWRVGYAAGPPEVIATMTKLQENIVSCAPSVSQMAALAALSSGRPFLDSMIEMYRNRREVALGMLGEIEGIRVHRPAGTFYIFADVSALTDSCEQFALDLLASDRLVVVPGTAFGPRGEGHVRISYATSEEKITEGMKRLRRFVEHHSTPLRSARRHH